jgi:hypothetical protein
VKRYQAADARYAVAWTIIAHAVRAILLASATAMTMGRFDRSFMPMIHGIAFLGDPRVRPKTGPWAGCGVGLQDAAEVLSRRGMPANYLASCLANDPLGASVTEATIIRMPSPAATCDQTLACATAGSRSRIAYCSALLSRLCRT